MLSTLVPATASNAYRGSRIAMWVLVALTTVTLVRSLIHLFAPDGGAQSIATIPLDAFTDNGAATVIHLFGLWGLSQLLLALVTVVVLWRYRTLIPLIYLLMIVEYAGRMALGFAKPFEIAGTAPGGVANPYVVVLAAVMLMLSLRQTRRA